MPKGVLDKDNSIVNFRKFNPEDNPIKDIFPDSETTMDLNVQGQAADGELSTKKVKDLKAPIKIELNVKGKPGFKCNYYDPE